MAPQRGGDSSEHDARRHLSPDERALVDAVRSGDAAAFSVLVRTYAAGLCSFVASYVGSPETTEELVQDLLFRLWEQRARWEVRDTLRSYLYTAARNHALNHLRRQRLEAAWEAEAVRDAQIAGIGQGTGGADDGLYLEELDAALRRGISALPPRCREVYLLTREHHLSYAEVARVMGIAPKTVGVQVGIALRALRQHLADWVRT